MFAYLLWRCIYSMAKPTRSAFWKCAFFGSLYCLTGCSKTPPCAADPSWSEWTQCIIESPNPGKQEICRAPDCPCWAGSASTQLALKERRQRFIDIAFDYFYWCKRAERTTTDLPIHDLGVWLTVWRQLDEYAATPNESGNVDTGMLECLQLLADTKAQFEVLYQRRRHASPLRFVASGNDRDDYNDEEEGGDI